MSTEVYYFSGTGNSLVVAEDIAKSINGTLIPITSMINKKSIKPEANVIGIVFPVYYTDLPIVVKQFAKKLVELKGKYIFAISTYGGGVGNSLNHLKQIIYEQGGELSAMFGVHMPQNAFHKPWDNYQKLFDNWNKKMVKVSNNIKMRKKGMLLSDRFLYLLLYPINKLINIIYKSTFPNYSDSPSSLPIDDLIHLADRSFNINNKCNGCGICARVCPVNNIELVNNKPIWLKHCENCLACYNFCPNKAIKTGIAAEGYFYKHPDIKVSNLIHQKTVPKN